MSQACCKLVVCGKVVPCKSALKMNEHKQDQHEDIKKKLDIFHLLNGILAKTRDTIFQKRFPGRIVDS